MANLAPEKRTYYTPGLSATNSKGSRDTKLDIRVFALDEPKGSTKAFASVGIDDLIAIRGVRVVEGGKGAFVAMPQSKDKDGEFHDIAFPLTGELRKAIAKAVLEDYKVAEKTVQRKPSLADGLRNGAAKAAGHTAAPREAAKSRTGAGVLS